MGNLYMVYYNWVFLQLVLTVSYYVQKIVCNIEYITSSDYKIE